MGGGSIGGNWCLWGLLLEIARWEVGVGEGSPRVVDGSAVKGRRQLLGQICHELCG